MRGFAKKPVPLLTLHPEQEEAVEIRSERDRLWFREHPEFDTYLRRPTADEVGESTMLGYSEPVLMVVHQIQPGSRVRFPISANDIICSPKKLIRADELAAQWLEPMGIDCWVFTPEQQKLIDSIRKGLKRLRSSSKSALQKRLGGSKLW